jgi:hypothetical protein
MTRLSLVLALSIPLLAACGGNGGDAAGAQESPSAGGIVIVSSGEARPYFHDFGEIPWGDVAEHTFVLRNTESVAVTLLDVQGNCACTSVRKLVARHADGTVVEGDPRASDGMLEVPPGASAEMTLRVDSSKITANQEKLEVLRLSTTSTRTPYLTFEAHVFPRHHFQVTPRELDLQDVPQAAGKSGVVHIVTGFPGSPARVLEVAQQGERVRATLDESVAPTEMIWVLTVTVPENEPMGVLMDRVVLSTTDGAGQGSDGRLAVEVSARIVEDVLIYPRQINLGALTQQESKTVPAEVRALAPGMHVNVLGARVEGDAADHLDVSWTAVSPDTNGRSENWKLAIAVQPGLPAGQVAGTLVVTLDDQQYPELRAPLRGYVR